MTKRSLVRQLRQVVAILLLSALGTPAYSLDPLTLILLRIVRDKIISAGIESAVDRANGPNANSPPVAAVPSLPLNLDDTQLRQLIDEGFVHLTVVQRGEVYQHVRRILLDPKHAAEAPSIIADLAIKASAVRQAHESLNNLSFARKQRIATEAREEYEKLPPETREELASALRSRVVPMPADLTDMILAEFDRVRRQVPDAAGVTAPR